MSKSQPVTQSTTQQTAIPAWLTNMSKAAGLQGENLPGYTAYTGPGVAGLSPDQLQALGLASGNVGGAGGVATSALPSLTALTGYQNPTISAATLNPEITGLLNPYTQNVIDAAGRQIDVNTGQAINASDNQFAGQHAFGGDRQAVADAVIRSNANLQKAQIASDLISKGYDTATATALAEQQANQSAAQGAAGVRLGGANALTGLGSTLSGINAQDLAGLLTAGGTQQQVQNAANMFGYQQYLNQFQIPDTQAQTFASILGALPHNTSTTGTQTSTVYSNPLLQLGGLGLGIAGLGTGGGATLGGTAISSAAPALLGLLSDRRMKTDINQVGTLFDGTPVYRYRLKTGDPNSPMQIGLMAQDIERSNPAAVTEVEGIKHVNYELATDLAVSMSGELREGR